MALRTSEYLMNQFKKSPNWKALSEEDLSHLKRVMVSIADDFVKTCDKYKLKYIMGAGTCLGSVRHKGYIPWDDDIDFHMPRKDYNRFLRVAEKELGKKYYIKSVSKGDDVCFSTIHIRLKGTKYINYGDLVLTENEPLVERGIYIDIFPYDNVFSNKILRYIHGIISLVILFIISSIMMHKSIYYLKKNNVDIDSDAKKNFFLKNIIGTIAGIIPLNKWVKFSDKFNSMYHNDKSEYITCFMGRDLNKYTHRRKDLYGKDNYGEFEGHIWRLPSNPDIYLSKEYSKDYMTPPPEDKRKIHPVFYLEFK